MKEIIDPLGRKYSCGCGGTSCYKCIFKEGSALCRYFRKHYELEMDIKPMLYYTGGRKL